MSVHHAPGIYFGMPEDEYHADKALGSSSIKDIVVDPYEWQFDRLYGEDTDTDAMIFGSAVHARMLEGVDALHAKFCPEFDKSTTKDALDTVKDLQKFLDEHGQRGLSGKKKDDLIQMALDISPSVRIVDVIKKRWEAANEGKTPLKPKRWAQIEVAARWVQRDPLLSAVMDNGTFSHGAPEVSIFYEDRGVRLKARLDRLLRHAIVDLKTFAPMFAGQMESTALKVIDRMRYDIQAADYFRAWAFAKELHAKGLVFGQEPFEGFLAECFDRDAPKWIWILIKSKGAPQPLVIDWTASMAMGAAAQSVERAIETYIRLRDEFGEDAEWIPMRQALTVRDTDLPTWFGNSR